MLEFNRTVVKRAWQVSGVLDRLYLTDCGDQPSIIITLDQSRARDFLVRRSQLGYPGGHPAIAATLNGENSQVRYDTGTMALSESSVSTIAGADLFWRKSKRPQRGDSWIGMRWGSFKRLTIGAAISLTMSIQLVMYEAGVV